MNRIELTKPYRGLGLLLLSLAFAASSGGAAHAALTLTGPLNLNRSANVLQNGSFEDHPTGGATEYYWAAGTANSPFAAPGFWTTGGGPNNYALWSDSAAFHGSDTLPHGTAGLYFGNGLVTSMSQTPTFNPNGTVTFPAPPTIASLPGYAPPVTLSQTLTGLSLSQTYGLTFWVSGEDAAFNQGFDHDGFFALDVTGYSTEYLATPWAGSSLGLSLVYNYTFTPVSPTTTISFTNWGHPYSGTVGWPAAYGAFATELVLDDVIVNPLPEPGSLALIAIGGVTLFAAVARRRRGFRGMLAACVCGALVLGNSSVSHAALAIGSGLGTTHTGNLVLNGSFELGGPPDGVKPFWANSSNSPYFVPPLWTSNNNGNSAVWGNDGASPYRLSASDVLPDGRIGVNFHTATGVTVSPQPTFNPNGEVTFASTPVFTSPAGAPVVLRQTVNTQLSPAPSYKMSFWISGEENATVQGFNGVGIIGMQLTNVLPGDPVQWLVAPNGLSYGQSMLYEYTFTPLNTSLPVDLRFVNWGGLDLSPYGGSQFGTQPILDDVIINGVPEPSSVVLLGLGMAAMIVGVRRKRRRQCNRAAQAA